MYGDGAGRPTAFCFGLTSTTCFFLVSTWTTFAGAAPLEDPVGLERAAAAAVGVTTGGKPFPPDEDACAAPVAQNQNQIELKQ